MHVEIRCRTQEALCVLDREWRDDIVRVGARKGQDPGHKCGLGCRVFYRESVRWGRVICLYANGVSYQA